MAVHGGERGIPRRLGIDVASIAAGVLAAQGVLAAHFARMRGVTLRHVETSVWHGALSYLRHHLAIASSGGAFPFQTSAAGLGPPFPTSDGIWIEIEALRGDVWIAFWKSLGVTEQVAAQTWLPFVYRYLAGRCPLPPDLHEATRRQPFAVIASAGASHGVAVVPLRTEGDVFAASAPPFWMLTPCAGVNRADGSTTAHTRDAPLAGIRVVEVTSRLQGPLAGQLLRQLGADVVKVEPPGGDFGRWSPPFAGKLGAAYLAYNHGKRVEELDYKRAADRARLLELTANADVFLHNWPSGRAERLALDFAALRSCNPRIVYAHASGWGPLTPAPASIAGDQLVQAFAGIGQWLSPRDESCFPSRLTIVDTMGGLLACEGILAGLCVRERQGGGVRVETSLLSGARVLRGVGQPRQLPWPVVERPIATADGYLAVGAMNEWHRGRVARLVGLDGAAPDSALEGALTRLFATLPTSHWIATLANAGIHAARVRTNLAARPLEWCDALLERVNDACRAPAPPWAFSD